MNEQGFNDELPLERNMLNVPNFAGYVPPSCDEKLTCASFTPDELREFERFVFDGVNTGNLLDRVDWN